MGRSASITELPSIAAVDIGLRTMIGGLKAEFSKKEYADKIKSLAQSHQILDPSEGCLSGLLHDKVLQAIQDLAYEWVWIGDEFGTERKLYWIEDLKGKDTKATAGHCNVFTPDKALLWTTHWDSHFSFLCSSKRDLVAIQAANHFEGFFCTPSTEVYWSVPSLTTDLEVGQDTRRTTVSDQIDFTPDDVLGFEFCDHPVTAESNAVLTVMFKDGTERKFTGDAVAKVSGILQDYSPPNA